MKSFLWFLSFLLITPLSHSSSFRVLEYHRTPQTPYIVRQVLANYSQDQLVQELRHFVSCCRPNRLVGSPSHGMLIPFLNERIDHFAQRAPHADLTVRSEEFTPDYDFAIQHFAAQFAQEIQGVVEEDNPAHQMAQTFTQSMIDHLTNLKERKVGGVNFIVEKRGSTYPNEVLILGASMDTLLLDQETWKVGIEGEMPGADGHGSGVSILLALAQVLHHINVPRTIRLIFFDHHEHGALGARAYVQRHRTELKEQTHAFIQLAQLGHDRNNGNLKLYIRPNDEEAAPPDHDVAMDLLARMRAVGASVNFETDSRGFALSNQSAFWEAGIPSVVLSHNREDDLNPRLQTPNDFVETLNFRTLSGAFRTIAGAAIAWAYQF
jgi:hypothetical protein